MSRPKWKSFPETQPTEGSFRHYFADALGGYYGRAHELFRLYGPENSFKLCNLLWLAQQKGNVADIVELLEERWRSNFSRIADRVDRGLVFRSFVDTCYLEHFAELYAGLPVTRASGPVQLPGETVTSGGILLPRGVNLGS